MKSITAATEFETSKGTKVVVTAELVLEEIHYADGDNITVDCCKMGLIKADINGFPQQAGYRELPKPIEHPGTGLMIHATIGKLGLTAEHTDKVKSAITELEQHPRWIAKQAEIKKNREEIEKMEAARDAHPGYCRKCGSYCYGDCEAN